METGLVTWWNILIIYIYYNYKTIYDLTLWLYAYACRIHINHYTIIINYIYDSSELTTRVNSNEYNLFLIQNLFAFGSCICFDYKVLSQCQSWELEEQSFSLLYCDSLRPIRTIIIIIIITTKVYNNIYILIVCLEYYYSLNSLIIIIIGKLSLIYYILSLGNWTQHNYWLKIHKSNYNTIAPSGVRTHPSVLISLIFITGSEIRTRDLLCVRQSS